MSNTSVILASTLKYKEFYKLTLEGVILPGYFIANLKG